MMMNKYLNVDEEDLPQWQFTLHERGVCSSVCLDVGSTDSSCYQFPDDAIIKSHQGYHESVGWILE